MRERDCVKCGGTEVSQKEVSMTGLVCPKLFDVQHNQFLVISCTQCGYSEFYNKQS